MDIFESLENLNVSEECFNDIISIVEEYINESTREVLDAKQNKLWNKANRIMVTPFKTPKYKERANQIYKNTHKQLRHLEGLKDKLSAASLEGYHKKGKEGQQRGVINKDGTPTEEAKKFYPKNLGDKGIYVVPGDDPNSAYNYFNGEHTKNGAGQRETDFHRRVSNARK